MKFKFRFESLKSISVLILFVYKLMIGSSKNNRENYPRKCFWTQEKEIWVKFNPGVRANRPLDNCTQLKFSALPYINNILMKLCYFMHSLPVHLLISLFLVIWFDFLITRTFFDFPARIELSVVNCISL